MSIGRLGDAGRSSERVEARRHQEHEDARWGPGGTSRLESRRARSAAVVSGEIDAARVTRPFVRLRVLRAFVLQLIQTDQVPPEEPHPTAFTAGFISAVRRGSARAGHAATAASPPVHGAGAIASVIANRRDAWSLGAGYVAGPEPLT